MIVINTIGICLYDMTKYSQRYRLDVVMTIHQSIDSDVFMPTASCIDSDDIYKYSRVYTLMIVI